MCPGRNETAIGHLKIVFFLTMLKFIQASHYVSFVALQPSLGVENLKIRFFFYR